MVNGPRGETHHMRISAKADYAIRATLELAAAEGDGPVGGEELARSQHIPAGFLSNILADLSRAGIVRTRRGREGGYQLARPAAEITVADILRAIDGPLAAVQGSRPETLKYAGAVERLTDVWVAVRASLRSILEHVTLEQISHNHLPGVVKEQTRRQDAWRPH